MVNQKDTANNEYGPVAWNVLRKVKIGTHGTLESLMADLPEGQVKINDKKALSYQIGHEQREVKLVAPKVCRLGFSNDVVSAKQVIERGLQYPYLSSSPVDAVVKLRNRYHDQPAGDTCIGSHYPIKSDQLLVVRRSPWGSRVIEAWSAESKFSPDHRFIFEVYKNI